MGFLPGTSSIIGKPREMPASMVETGYFRASARNFSSPMSVNGCFIICQSTFGGHVQMSAPIIADSWT